MDQAWHCPACQAIIAYDDYDTAVSGKVFSCRKCGLALMVDRKMDQPVTAVKESPTKPTANE
jgi:hypothetical protein